MTTTGERPPRLGRYLLAFRQLGDRRQEIEADLLELFHARIRTHGRRGAALRYILDAASLWHWRIGATLNAAPDARRWRVSDVSRDVVFAIRMFSHQPATVLMTVGGLSLAIGVSTVILTLVDATVPNDTGIREPERVRSVAVVDSRKTPDSVRDAALHGSFDYSDFLRLGAGIPSMDLAADSPFTIGVDVRDSADSGSTNAIQMMPVSGNYFTVLGGRAVHGRTLLPGDDLAGADQVVVLSQAVWKRRFGADPGMLGRTLWLDDSPFTVVGVIESGFIGAYGSKFQTMPGIWTTFASQARKRADLRVDLVGRLRPGASSDRAQSELTALARVLAAERTEGPRAVTVLVGPVDRLRVDPALVTAVAVIVAVLLALAGANVTNLLLANAAGRRREIGTRLALGASRGRIVVQLLTESVLLSACSGVAGLLMSSWLAPVVARWLDLPVITDLAPEAGTYFVTALIAVTSGVVAGLAPARFGWRGHLVQALQSDRDSTAAGPWRLRSLLVGSQAAVCMVLLAIAALLTHAAAGLAAIDPGVAIDRLAYVSPEFGSGGDAGRRTTYVSTALGHLRRLPRVQDVALAAVPPFHFMHAAEPLTGSMVVPGPARTQRNEVSANYFRTVGLQFVQGRPFTDEEVRNGSPVAVITSILARQFWGDESPLGATMERVWGPSGTEAARPGNLMRKPPGTRVVGVVADSMTQIEDAGVPTIYLPIDAAHGAVHLVVSTADDPREVVPDIRQAMAALEPGQAPTIALPRDRLRNALEVSRALAMTTSAIGACALALALVGLFGVTAFVTGQRRREISIRLALGASGAGIFRMLVRDSLRPVALGLAAGLVLAFAAGRLLITARVLRGVSSPDPLAIAAATVILLTAAALATFVPARRAARNDPAASLKQD